MAAYRRQGGRHEDQDQYQSWNRRRNCHRANALVMLTAEQFGIEYEKGIPKLVSLLCVRGIPEAEEIAQAAWCKAWEKRNQLRDSNFLRQWVSEIAMRIYLTQRRRMKFTESQLIPDMDQPGEYPVRLHHAIVGQLRRRMHANDWRPLDLFYLRGLTIEEMSAVLGYEHLSTARVRLMRSRKAALQIMGRSRKAEAPLAQHL